MRWKHQSLRDVWERVKLSEWPAARFFQSWALCYAAWHRLRYMIINICVNILLLSWETLFKWALQIPHMICDLPWLNYVKALRYKPEGRGFDTRWGDFYIYLILPAALGPGVYLASNRNEYQKLKNHWGVKCGRCVGLTTLPRSEPIV
jgi:hypothetical protein